MTKQIIKYFKKYREKIASIFYRQKENRNQVFKGKREERYTENNTKNRGPYRRYFKMISKEEEKNYKKPKISKIWNFLIYGSTIAIGIFLIWLYSAYIFINKWN